MKEARQCGLMIWIKRALLKLDDGVIFSSGDEVAVISGEMEIKLVRPPDADGGQFLLTIMFPSGRDFLIRLGRRQTLEQLDVEGGEDV